MNREASGTGSAIDSDALPGDALEVGRIVEAWGLKGGLRVQPYATPASALLAARRWYLRAAEQVAHLPNRSSTGLPAWIDIGDVREHGEGLVATSKAVPDRTAAEALRGARIFVARTAFPQPDADEFYWADLIGMAVANREGAPLGQVAGLIDTGPHCVLRVEAAGAEERLIPFVSAYVDSVDLPARRVVVDWGLDY